MRISATAAAGALLLLAGNAEAFFRVLCGTLAVDRADPIINPGAASGHLHTISGGNGFDFSMTYDDARASTCSTCRPKADSSNYWTPSLWFRAQNGTFRQVQQDGMTVYYFQRPNGTAPLQAFPKGFRMIAGDPTKRSYDNSIEASQVTHMCIQPNAQDSSQTNGLPSIQCPANLRTQVFFPSCWNGKDVDSDDHKSHVAYPDGGDNGECPPGFPVRLVSIFYEVNWKTGEFSDEWWTPEGADQPFVLSNGDPTGYGFHGDFINGWDVDVLQSAADQCLNGSGVIEDCHLLELRDPDEMEDCMLPQRVPDTIDGYVDRLPGCNDVTSGPDDAQMQPPSSCGATTQILPKNQTWTPTISPVDGWTILGCSGDDPAARVMTGARYTPGGMTPQLCTQLCSDNGFEYAGLEWALECYCDHNFDTSKLTARKCDKPCEGDPSLLCGGDNRLAVYQQGGPGNAPSTTAAPTTESSAPSSTESSAPSSTESSAPSSTDSSPSSSTESSPSSTELPPSTEPPVPSWTSTSPEPTSEPTTEPVSEPTQLPDGNGTAMAQGLGCYIDNLESPVLANHTSTDIKQTVDMCRTTCLNKGYTYAGLVWSWECCATCPALAIRARNAVGPTACLCGTPTGRQILRVPRACPRRSRRPRQICRRLRLRRHQLARIPAMTETRSSARRITTTMMRVTCSRRQCARSTTSPPQSGRCMAKVSRKPSERVRHPGFGRSCYLS
ncbi:WSC-domain-containing protein [Exidia glandulosa HHB12029]|uniref:WSC-domain-containing protein n=1 Tax=Exidia glandulosa HHB12029 TaxID=1314781 RepID=A0A166A370_EXIGL|nr:WSC-domain-containing protein [Exidia glandulosa HHB12029]